MAVTLSRDALAYETTAPATSGSRAWRRFAFNPVFPMFCAVNANDTLAIWRLDTGEHHS